MKRSLRKRRLARRLRLEALESRLTMHAHGLDEVNLSHAHSGLERSADPAGQVIVDEASLFVPEALATTTEVAAAPSQAPAAQYALSSVPALSSLPGATASLYLDFDGHYDPQWGSYGSITTPAFDQDGNPGAFSDSELATMRRIWEYVAEDYAPFQINVTTVEPPGFANGQALRVVIGGDSAWLGGAYGGIAYIDSFTNSAANSVYVFPKNLANGNAKYTADASSHEAGHGFGLQHQSAYNSSGAKTTEYYAGPGDGSAPLMGNSYSATRSLWWNGTSSRSSTSYQDDMTVLARYANGFGLRPDDHGNARGDASPLTIAGGQASATGLIGTTDDVDYFSFNAGPGLVNLTIDVPSGIQNLDATAELYDATGSVLAVAAPTTAFGATVSATVPGGTYYLRVGGDGGHGDVGTYTVRGSVPAFGAVAVAAPTGLAATAVSTSRIDVSWTDVAGETGYQVERSQDGTNWSRVASLAANTTRLQNTGLAANTQYYYRVRATSASGNSPYSESVFAKTLAAASTTRPAAPSKLTAAPASSNQVNLAWQDNSSNETGFRIERYHRTSGRWLLLAQVGANVTGHLDTTVSGGQTYYYRVQALNGTITSSLSNTAKAVTPATSLSLARAEPAGEAPSAAPMSVARRAVAPLPGAERLQRMLEQEPERLVRKATERMAPWLAGLDSLLRDGRRFAATPQICQPSTDTRLVDAAFSDDGWLERLHGSRSWM